MLPPRSSSPSYHSFAATRWSVVLAAGHWPAGTASRDAMGELAKQYWFPLYAYLRRQGNSPAQAEDLVQGFFARLLEKEALAAVDRSKGKFRSFLLAALKNFMRDEWDKGRAAKRGGAVHVLSLDTVGAEARYAAEPVDERTPEQVFQRRWAHAVVERVISRLRGDYAARGQESVFRALQHVLVGDPGAVYGQIARQLGMTQDAVKVAAHRLRRRFRTLLREEIAHTVAEPGLVDEEIRQLWGSL